MNKLIQLTYIFICVSTISACSSKSINNTLDYDDMGIILTKDYVDHLASAGPDYLASEETKTIKLRQETIDFLESIYERIVSNNQLILKIYEKPKFYIIRHKSPFLFSLPKSQFFFSSALIERYFKSEEIFVAALTAEVIRSQKLIYEKKIMIPLGHYTTEQMIGLTKLKFSTKQQVGEWTYFVMRRAGYDATAYLNWIQIQNRNTVDFAMFLGDSAGISKEEHLFKNFMTKQGTIGVDRRFNEANSSKNFYKLINNVESGK